MRGRRELALGSIGGSTSVTTRLAAAVVGVSLASLVVATVVGLTAGRNLGRELFEDRLVAMRASASFDAGGQLRSVENTAEALASSPQAAAAIAEFTDAHAELRSTTLTETERDALVTHYQATYLEPLREAGREVNLRDVAVENNAGAYLQYHYAVDIGEIARPSSVVEPDDGSTWTDVHRTIHPVYRDVVSRAGLVDLFLVEPRNGYIVYSVRKRSDLGSSLDTGPFSGSALATVTSRLRDDPSLGVITSDLAFYDPAVTTPVGVVAAPVLDGGRLAGVLVLMFDSTPFTGLLSADGDWSGARFPDTGETFLVGVDGTTRSEPRSFLEDPRAHLDAAQAAGLLTDEERRFIEVAGTTVLTQRVARETADAGPGADDAVVERNTLDGRAAFSTVAPVENDHVSWWAVAELEVDAAEGDLRDFQELLIAGTAIFVVALAFLAVGWANSIVQPVRTISDRLAADRRTDREPLVLPPRSPIEFQQLATSFGAMIEALGTQQRQLTEARDGRLRLLRQLLPRQVAQRVAHGDLGTVEEVTDASAVVVVVLAPEASPDDHSRSDLLAVEELHADLDDLAQRHGLERIKIVGDSYFAACGHDRPYLDHAPRTLAFASDARDAAADIGTRTGVPLDVTVGIDGGAMSVGMAGGAGLVYDVWGPAVRGAQRLSRRAGRGEILLSDRTRRQLPDEVRSTRTGDDDDRAWRLTEQAPEARS